MPRPQRRGRWDNAELYDALYVAATPVGALAEAFWSFATWTPAMLLTPRGDRRAVVTLDIPNDAVFVDLDDVDTLRRFDLRPSSIVRRDPSRTQEIAARIFTETRGDDRPPIGLKWWSAALPSEDVYLLWVPPGESQIAREVEVHDLDLAHPFVIEAAAALPRALRDA